jgi:hypothetical protein
MQVPSVLYIASVKVRTERGVETFVSAPKESKTGALLGLLRNNLTLIGSPKVFYTEFNAGIVSEDI